MEDNGASLSPSVLGGQRTHRDLLVLKFYVAYAKGKTKSQIKGALFLMI